MMMESDLRLQQVISKGIKICSTTEHFSDAIDKVFVRQTDARDCGAVADPRDKNGSS
jgi:hypothetical protein